MSVEQRLAILEIQVNSLLKQTEVLEDIVEKLRKMITKAEWLSILLVQTNLRQTKKTEVDIRKDYYDEKVDRLEKRLTKLEKLVNDLIDCILRSLDRSIKRDEEFLKRRIEKD